MKALRNLGKTNLRVSGLCFGTLTLSPMQANLSHSEGGELLLYAYENGVNFWDTAELYQTYGHIRHALRRMSKRPVIATKSYAYSSEGAKESFEKFCRETKLDGPDIFLLHEQTGVLTILGHQEALKYYISLRDKGLIKAVGISTHAIEVVRAVAFAKGSDLPGKTLDLFKEFDLSLLREIDVVHPILNFTGIGIIDGTALEMADAVRTLNETGTGIYAMKIFGGGNLLKSAGEAAKFVLKPGLADSVAIGMKSKSEIDFNIRMIEGVNISDAEFETIANSPRRLHIEYYCIGCGACVHRCNQGALTLTNGRASVNHEKCVLCGYCASVCPEFAIKVL